MQGPMNVKFKKLRLRKQIDHQLTSILGAVAQLVEALPYKAEGRGFQSR